MSEKTGTRRDYTDNNIPLAGEYGKNEVGQWYGVPPGTDLLANLSGHQVIEHEDRTITVSPSILVRLPHKNEEWHGFLERGVWKEV
jgi:hypothetical protein